jgi:hypothetical protein
MPNPRPIAERFAEKYEIVPWSGCWLWTGSTMANGGYGKITYHQGDQKQMGAHRVSWLLHKGPIPEGLWVLHRCDVPACVNPEHLFLGTAKENIEDCIRKGRNKTRPKTGRKPRVYIRKGRPIQIGEDNHNVRLSWDIVRDIRTHRLTKAEFARVYGVSFKAVWNIWNFKAWVESE